jgi:hypothetical protein
LEQLGVDVAWRTDGSWPVLDRRIAVHIALAVQLVANALALHTVVLAVVGNRQNLDREETWAVSG